MVLVIVRFLLLGLVGWLLWRLAVAVFSGRPASRERAKDEWGEVLEAIDDLPETTEARHRGGDDDLAPESPDDLADDAAPIESVMLHEAEAALSMIREGDEEDRLAAYHEIITYEKLCAISDSGISEATWRQIDAIRRQAWQMLDRSDQSC